MKRQMNESKVVRTVMREFDCSALVIMSQRDYDLLIASYTGPTLDIQIAVVKL